MLLTPLIPLLYSLLVVSSLCSKTLHLAQHARSHSLPRSEFLLYLPTLFAQDALVVGLGRLLLRGPDGLMQYLTCGIGGLAAMITYAAAAMQIGFYWETGSQIEWAASGSFLRDPAAMKILLSGMRSVTLAAVALLVLAYMTTPYLYTTVGACRSLFHTSSNSNNEGVLPQATISTAENKPSSSSSSLYRRRRRVFLVAAIIVAVILLFLRLHRPSLPYDHLASTLPFALSAAFHRQPRHRCPQSTAITPFPFPELVEPARWEQPVGASPGWVPDRSWPATWPKWLPEIPPPGFSRWEVGNQHGHKHKDEDEEVCKEGKERATYNAATDPSKISNMDNHIYKPLKTALDQHAVTIEHIVLLTLESARAETFPMRPGSALYDMILDSHSPQTRAAGIDRLAAMTPTAQMVTGEFAANATGQRSRSESESESEFEGWPWQSHSTGGIHVHGAVTGSSLTLKSLLTSHCGVMPLPVDLLEEVTRDIYQPCLPHILGLFNSKKTKTQAQFQDRPWRSVFAQSSTDSYDRQSLLTRRMGFGESIVKGTLDDPSSKHYPPRSKEINYFGYAEEELAPYLRDAIFEAAQNKTRLFLSHLTSTTHHPWNLPASMAPRTEYFGELRSGQKHTDLNSFLNTVRYVDRWVGQILAYLDEAGIAERTLVVVVGDHGQAFGEDDWGTQGTYENSHISNFRVPLLFRHPRLPHVDVAANATALSILPTILDLLVASNSLDAHDRRVAEWLAPEYQGQSLARPYKSEQRGRRAWNMGVINAGGSLLAVSSAGDPFRLVVPVQDGRTADDDGDNSSSSDKVFEYRFTHTGSDPEERQPLQRWSLDALLDAVARAYGGEAARWAESAALMGRWWIDEQKRIWNYP